MTSEAQVISTLNNLIQTCRDGQEGFQAAAGGVRDAALKELFYEYSRQRASFAGELQDEVRRLGGEPAEAGSVTASLHRGWMGLRAALEGDDDRAIVAESLRGEEMALETYRSALGTDMPANVRSLVERQFADIKEAHNVIRNLERGSGAGA